MIFFLILFLTTSSLFSVSTKYAGGFRFDKIEDYELSNITFLENGSIELSPELNNIFEIDRIIWSVTEIENDLLIASGEKASLFLLNNKGYREVFSSKENILFSDIMLFQKKILLTALPDATLFILNEKFEIENKIKFTNQYLWKILNYKDKIILFAGNPANIYIIDKNFKIEHTIDFYNKEKNILNGIIYNDELYFFSDSNTLYKLSLKNKIFTPIISVEDSIVDISTANNEIYLLTGQRKTKEQQKKDKKNNSNVSSDQDISNPIDTKSKSSQPTSKLYLFNYSDNTLTKVFESSLSFISMSVLKDKIFISIDEQGGFFEISKNLPIKFISSGDGKFIKLIRTKTKFYGITIEPSRVYEINENSFSKNGFFASGIFDCEIKSKFGQIIYDGTTPLKTEVKFFTKSGSTSDESFWGKWEQIENNKIKSEDNRFIKYKIELSSDGKNTPRINYLYIPFIQYNVAPYIEKFEINQQGNNYKFNWQATDENKDNITYDIFVKIDNTEFVKLNESPIEDSYFDIQKELFGDGIYYFKLLASDFKSNQDNPKESYKIIGPYLIDNTPPDVVDIKLQAKRIVFSVKDKLSPIISVSYSVNGKKWTKLNPIDNLYDQKEENFSIELTGNELFILIKATDLYGNSIIKKIK
ncbi:MAG: hypothetical protein N2258_08630 [Brevinematales bacterium]|nr:hypothetical protein [Brevinematales bacterium]